MSVSPTSRWEARDHAENAGFAPALGAPVLALGWRDGVLTAKIAEAAGRGLDTVFSN